MILFIPSGKNNGGFTSLGEKVIGMLGCGFTIGLVLALFGTFLDLSETVINFMLGLPTGLGLIVSVVMLVRGKEKE